jgi:hypothetical protein
MITEVRLSANPFEIFVDCPVKGDYGLPPERSEFARLRKDMSGVAETIHAGKLRFHGPPCAFSNQPCVFQYRNLTVSTDVKDLKVSAIIFEYEEVSSCYIMHRNVIP